MKWRGSPKKKMGMDGVLGELGARTGDRRRLDELAGEALPILETSTSLCTVGLVFFFAFSRCNHNND